MSEVCGALNELDHHTLQAFNAQSSRERGSASALWRGRPDWDVSTDEYSADVLDLRDILCAVVGHVAKNRGGTPVL